MGLSYPILTLVNFFLGLDINYIITHCFVVILRCPSHSPLQQLRADPRLPLVDSQIMSCDLWRHTCLCSRLPKIYFLNYYSTYPCIMSTIPDKLCSKPSCKNPVSNDDLNRHGETYQKCKSCRAKDTASTAARRKRNREDHTHGSEQGPSVRPRIGPSIPGDDNLGWNKGTTSSEEESLKVSHQSIIFAHHLGVIIYKDSESILKELRSKFGCKEVDFAGKYTLAANSMVSDRERVQMTIQDIWKITGYRFT